MGGKDVGRVRGAGEEDQRCWGAERGVRDAGRGQRCWEVDGVARGAGEAGRSLRSRGCWGWQVTGAGEGGQECCEDESGAEGVRDAEEVSVFCWKGAWGLGL